MIQGIAMIFKHLQYNDIQIDTVEWYTNLDLDFIFIASPTRFNLSPGLKFEWMFLVQSTTRLEHLFCGNRVKLLGCEQCSASFCLRIFSGFDLFFRRLPYVLGFCHSIAAILTCASVDLSSCGVKCWLPWWWWDKRTLFHWHCMGWQGYI